MSFEGIARGTVYNVHKRTLSGSEFQTDNTATENACQTVGSGSL